MSAKPSSLLGAPFISLLASSEAKGPIVLSNISSGLMAAALWRLKARAHSIRCISDSGAIHALASSGHPAGEGARNSCCPIDLSAGNNNCFLGKAAGLLDCSARNADIIISSGVLTFVPLISHADLRSIKAFETAARSPCVSLKTSAII